jgi:alpha-tubulin suppressor-like RCC1 family protein
LANGTVQTFGQNGFGNLGLNDTVSRQTPVQVVAISATVSVTPAPTAFLTSAATSITLAASGGQIWTSSATGVARTMAGSVAGGRYHTAVVLKDGTVRTFGRNNLGQLGVNDTTTRLTPVQVWGISSSATAVAGNQSHTAVLLADGTVRTFGSNAYGQLGVNDTTNRQTPVQVFGISSSATAIACGAYHTVVLLADGTARTFGNNGNGQLGINVSGGTRQTPVQVFGISSSATAVAGGYYHTAVLLADGTVRTFGGNAYGQLGTNDAVSRLTPVAVFGALGVNTATYVTAKGLALGLSAPTFQLDLSTDKARKLSTTTWTTGSDRRIKSDIQSANLVRCVDIVDSLDLKYFKWNIPSVNPTDSHSLGWIAQDVKQFFPNSVRLTQDYGFDDFHNLDSDQLIKTMYGALKKMCSDTYGQ